MMNRTCLWACVVLAMVLAGCIKQAPLMPLQVHTPPLVWPPSPEVPRIRYLYSISTPADIGWEPSLFQKVVGFFAGPEVGRRLVRPYGTCFSRDGVLYVADPGMKIVHKFSLSERRYEVISQYRKEAFVSPIGVALDDGGNLYISDSILKKVFVFDSGGGPAMVIGEQGNFRRPTGLAFNPGLQRLYVVDTLEHAVKAFDSRGKLVFTLGSRGSAQGQFNFPTAVTLDSAGNLYVNDSLNFRVQIFRPDGTFLSLFGRHGDGPGEFAQPKGVALDSQDNIYVTDALSDTVQIFSSRGTLLLSFGEAGQGPGHFWIPSSIFIGADDRIYVADSYNQRVQVFEFLAGNGS